MTIVRVNNAGLLLPLSVAQRGVGITSINSDELLLAGTTSTGDMQKVQMPADSLYISQGSSAVGSASANSRSLGCECTLDERVISSNTTNVNFTGWTSDFFQYVLDIYNIAPTASSDALIVRFSSNNGSSYDNGATDYFFWLGFQSQTAATFNTTNANTVGCRLDYNSVATTNTQNHFQLVFTNPLNSMDGNGFTFVGRYYDEGQAVPVMVKGHGRRNATIAINAIRVRFASFQIASATFRLRGIRA